MRTTLVTTMKNLYGFLRPKDSIKSSEHLTALRAARKLVSFACNQIDGRYPSDMTIEEIRLSIDLVDSAISEAEKAEENQP